MKSIKNIRKKIVAKQTDVRHTHIMELLTSKIDSDNCGDAFKGRKINFRFDFGSSSRYQVNPMSKFLCVGRQVMQNPNVVIVI